jgi:hypothetical protein
MSLFTQLQAYYNFHGLRSKSVDASPQSHRALTRAATSSSHWVHYNPITKEFKTWGDKGVHVTKDLSNVDIMKYSSKYRADETANHPPNQSQFAGFISVEVVEKTTFELA